MRKINELILNDVFPDWMLNKGIIKTLQQNHPVPWATSIQDGSILDLEYYGNRSGTKIVAPLLYKLITVEDNGISDANRAKLAALIWARYGTNWTKLWATMTLDYNPITNYDMTETESISDSGTSSNVRNIDGSTTSADSGTITDASTNSSDVIQKGGTKTENSVYGFNSASAVKAGESTSEYMTSGDGTKTSTTGTDSNTKTINTQNASSEDSTITDTAQDSKTSSRTLTRSGNIGVTTSQQMIESERQLWDWQFFEQVYSDIDEVLTIPSFGEGQTDWVEIVRESGSVYVLPQATNTTLGGVKAVDKTDVMTNQVGIDATGHLWSIPGSGASDVISVNGQTGVVVLTASDVGAVASGSLAAVATSGSYNDLTNKPNLATVATSGNYADLTNRPTIPAPYELQVAGPATLGGVKPVNKTSTMTGSVGVDSNGRLWTAPPEGGGAVDSVNGQTGVVVLTASDVGALPDTTVIPSTAADVHALPDTTVIPSTASQISYDNSESELEATNTQDAIDELNYNLANLRTFSDVEKVVGTFFGKTLYSKTVSFTNLVAFSTSTTDYVRRISLGSTNLTYMSLGQYAFKYSNNYWYDEFSFGVRLQLDATNGSVVVINENQSGRTIDLGYVTVYYTKD